MQVIANGMVLQTQQFSGIIFSGSSEGNTLVITDMLGNTVKQMTVTNKQVLIDVLDLNEGVYNILIQNTESRANKRVIIVR